MSLKKKEKEILVTKLDNDISDACVFMQIHICFNTFRFNDFMYLALITRFWRITVELINYDGVGHILHPYVLVAY